VTPAFYRATGFASILSALTTLILIFAPEFFLPVAEGLPGRMQRVTDPIYQFRAWTYQIHPLLAFAAALGVAAATRRVSPGLALAAVLGFGLWALTEAAQQSLTLFAYDDWRRAWLAGDPSVRQTMELRAAIYDGLWEAAYSLLLWGIIIGSACFAAILLRLPDTLSKVVGGFFALAAVQSILIQSAELGGPTLPEGLGYWLYPATQPLARVLIGLWLLRVALRGEPRVDAPA
jgi:uncharacterized membrane protein YraQ (UPF0718 family)